MKWGMHWLDKKAEYFRDTIVGRCERNIQYDLDKGWVSGMYQGQAISLYLRAFQLFKRKEYLEKAKTIFNFFKYPVTEGGALRLDDENNTWFEEYPTKEPSYVLNGFIYAPFGILDFFRVTASKEANSLFQKCMSTVSSNLWRYDKWYWSVYDQSKRQLVSYYYQKNVHIPLMEILFKLTGEGAFEFYARKWRKQLNNPFYRGLVQIMYRIQPRIKNLRNE